MEIEIKKAKIPEVKKIKELIDSTESANIQLTDMTEETYKNYLKNGLVVAAYSDKKIIGVCFGSLSEDY